MKDRLLLLRTKARLTQVELAEKIAVSDKVISKWENGESEPSIETLRSLSNFYDVSFDYLISGKANKKDLDVINRPLTDDELADDFLKQCNEIIKQRNLQKYKDLLLPKKVVEESTYRCPEIKFKGGVFKGEIFWQWKNVYTPYLDVKKLLLLDNYDLYVALIDLPATFGEMRYLMKKNNDVKGLELTKPKDMSSSEWTNEKPKKELNEKEICHLSDPRFVELLKRGKDSPYNEFLSWWLLDLLPSNKNFWLMVKTLLDNGAVYLKVEPRNGEYCTIVPDYLLTSVIYEVAKSKIK